MLLIPAIDLRAGRCVRLLRGDFAAETHYDFEPHELLMRYRTLGAEWIHVVDLDGARNGTQANRAVITALASQCDIRLQVGGGVRDRASIDELLRVGVDRIVIGSAAVEGPGEVAGWLAQYGAERICLAFDVRLDASGETLVHTRGWTTATRLSLWDAVTGFVGSGLMHVLCTDIERDGALTGPSLALYAQAVQRFPAIAWQASGGIRDAADLHSLHTTGVAAAISGKALLEERMTPTELRPYLPNASSPVSMSATAKS